MADSEPAPEQDTYVNRVWEVLAAVDEDPEGYFVMLPGHILAYLMDKVYSDDVLEAELSAYIRINNPPLPMRVHQSTTSRTRFVVISDTDGSVCSSGSSSDGGV